MSFNRIFLGCVFIVASLMIATPSWGQVPFRIKWEAPGPALCSGEVDPNEVVVEGWQTLTWPVSNSTADCGSLVILPNLGTVDAPPGKTYSVDKIEYTGLSGPVSISFDEVSPPAFIGFNGAEGTSIGVPDPVDPGPGADGGNALNILRSAGDVFAGVVVTLPPLPDDESFQNMSARVYVPPAPVAAGLTPYSQDFEALALASPAPGNTALGDDGWKLFTNVFEADGTTFVYNYNSPPDPAPNQSGPGAAFSNVVTAQGGPDQGDNQLVIFSDYNNLDHNIGRRIEANVFQEQTIGAGDVGKTFRVIFNAKKGDIAGATTANAFIKTVNGSVLSNFLTVDTTNLPETWDTYGIYLPIDAGLVGQILQFGFSSTASNFEPSGVVYDNINFGMAPCVGTLTLTGALTPGAYGAEISAQLTDAIANDAAGIAVQAPKVGFDGSNAGVAIGGEFTASNGVCAPTGGVGGDIAINGGFETGAFNDGSPDASWQQFPNGGTQTIVTTNPSEGTFAANVVVPTRVLGDPAVDNLLKNANLQAGALPDGAAIKVTWDMRGSLVGAGGVVFVELFSEKAGGGTNKAEIYTGGPIFPTSPTVWAPYEWNTTIANTAEGGAPGGVTLQLKVSCGPVEGCGADIFFDNVTITLP